MRKGLKPYIIAMSFTELSPMRILILMAAALLIACEGGTESDFERPDAGARQCEHAYEKQRSIASGQQRINGALLATRFQSLDALKSAIDIEYFNGGGYENTMVRLRHCSNGIEVVSELRAGISQGDLARARDGGFLERLRLLVRSPFAIMNREDLTKVYMLARRRGDLFGANDVAFYHLAEQSVRHINTAALAYLNPRDRGEKGFLNSFNHITAQAFITSCFSEALADFVADIHERYTMPALITGKFTEEQLNDSIKNPVDNYVDIINNEWGQEIGKELKAKYKITGDTHWTPELLANYLNDLQSYYCWAFQIGMKPFRPGDEIIVRFADKINRVMKMTTFNRR